MFSPISINGIKWSYVKQANVPVTYPTIKKTRSKITTAIPTIITAIISMVSLLTTFLSLIVFHTIGRLITALASEDTMVTLPANEAAIFPCMAMVAAAAVVLALEASLPKTGR